MTLRMYPAAILAAARASHARWDIPASVCLAQWALESAWGTAMPAGSNNPFGIKAIGTQPSVAATTHEVLNGKAMVVTARFRAFATLDEAFDAHGELLATNGHYAKARLVRHDADAFAHALTGIYATDPRYGEKLVAMMRAGKLYEYDDAAAAHGRSASAPLAASGAPIDASFPHPNWIGRLRSALGFTKAA